VSFPLKFEEPLCPQQVYTGNDVARRQPMRPTTVSDAGSGTADRRQCFRGGFVTAPARTFHLAAMLDAYQAGINVDKTLLSRPSRSLPTRPLSHG
jgi:hypothetical protein